MADPNARKRVKLTRAIILGGKHADIGSVHDVPPALAHRLVGEGSAEHVAREGDKPETGVGVNRKMQADNADLETSEVEPAPPAKVKDKK